MADPAKAATLPPQVAWTLLGALAGLTPALVAAAARVAAPIEATPERWLTVEEACDLFGVTPKWLYRHKKQLPHSQPSRKVLLFPEDKLRRWFVARKTD